MFAKAFILLMMFAILVSLGVAMFSLVTGKGGETRTVKALSWRIGLSLGLFVLLIVGYLTGFLHPHAL
jgi:Protein of unknown function (DUF2909)